MSAPQISVATSPGLAYAGQLADGGLDQYARSYSNNEESAEIAFGLFVTIDASAEDTGALLPTADTELPAGVVLLSQAYDKDSELGDTGLKPGVTMDVLSRGRVYVQAEEAVEPGDDVRVRIAIDDEEDPLQILGGFAGSTAVPDSMMVLTNARWLTTAAAGGLAVLEFDVLGMTLTADTE